MKAERDNAPRHDGQRTEQGTRAGVALPAPLLHGVAALSGLDLADVRVHDDSPAPGRLGALAFARGDEIHLAPGQRASLAHEAWHVVQQRQGRVRATWQAKGLDLNADHGLEREADAMGARALAVGRRAALPAVYGLPPGLRRGQRAALPVAQCNYATLGAMDKARADARVQRVYAEKAADFEQRLGRHLSEAPAALVAVDAMLDKVRRIVDAWAEYTGQTKLRVYAQEFRYDEGDKYFGAFKMTGAAIKKVFDSRNTFGKAQPARKKLKVVYNAVRNNNLAKWLKVAQDEIDEQQAAVALGRVQQPVRIVRSAAPVDLNALGPMAVEDVQPGFAHASGLDTPLSDPARMAAVRQASAQEKRNLTVGGVAKNTHIAAPNWFSSIARGTALEASQVDTANRDRLYNQNRNVRFAEQHTVRTGDLPDLTADEIRLIRERRSGADPGRVGKRDKGAFKARAADKIEWEQGRDAIMVMLNSPVDRAAEAIGARLEAGVSGSTGMMFAAAKNLGLGQTAMLERLRLAMLGWMLPNHDHTFWEIMRAAEIQGLPFATDPLHPGWQYEAPANYRPIAVAPLRNLLPEHVFPAHFLGAAQRDVVANRLPAATTLAGERHVVEMLGIDHASAGALDERAVAELRLLADDIRVTTFKAAGGALTAVQADAANALLRRHLRETTSFRWLAREHPVHAERWFAQLLHGAGKPLGDEQALLRQALPAALPAIGANTLAQRQWLVAAGVPELLLRDVADHLIPDLAQLAEIIARLPFDANLMLSDVANQTALRRLEATPQHQRVAQLIPMALRRPIVGRLIGRAHGNILERSIHGLADAQPRVRTAIARGLPDGLVGSVAAHAQSNAVFDHLDDVHNDVGTIATQPAGGRITALKQLVVANVAWQTWFDGQFGARRYDLVVVALADRAGIDLRPDADYKALLGAARALSTTSTIPLAQLATGFQAFGLTTAAQTLRDNLATQHLLVGATPFAALTPEEVASINAYSKLGGMGHWQAALGGLDTSDQSSSNKLPKLADRIQAAVSGLRKLPVAPGPVYSAARTDLAGNPVAAMQQYWAGKIESWDNFLSSAKSVDASFIPKAGYGVAFEIHGLKTGRDIMMLSTNRDEEEVLFPPGSRFSVVSVTDRSNLVADPDGHGKVWVRMVEI